MERTIIVCVASVSRSICEDNVSQDVWGILLYSSLYAVVGFACQIQACRLSFDVFQIYFSFSELHSLRRHGKHG